MLPNQRLLTRRAIVDRAQQRGVPLKLNTVHKDAAAGRGPVPIAHYGRRTELFDEASADLYINSKLVWVNSEDAR
jgi:hypothetical protein